MIGVIVFFVSLFAVLYLETTLMNWSGSRPDTPFNIAFFWTAAFGIPVMAIVNFIYICQMVYGS